MLGYVLGIPLGQALVPPVRDGLLLTIVLGMLLSRIPGGRRHSPAAPPGLLTLFALFALSGLVSAVGSFYPALSLSRAAYAPIAFLLFIAVQDVETTPGAFRRIIVLSAVVWLLGLDRVYQYATGQSLLGGNAMFKGRVAGSLPHPNDLALIPILLPIALGLLARERALAVRLFVLSSLPLAVLTTVLSQSRNAWLGLALGLGFFIIVGLDLTGQREPRGVHGSVLRRVRVRLRQHRQPSARAPWRTGRAQDQPVARGMGNVQGITAAGQGHPCLW